MDIVLITRDRPELTKQTISSMVKNAANWDSHQLVVVFDGSDDELAENSDLFEAIKFTPRHVFGVMTKKQLGVGGAKNFGAKELEAMSFKHSNSLLMFSDNDMYYLPNWDMSLVNLMTEFAPHYRSLGITQLGGWRHPFHALGRTITKGSGGGVYEVDAVTGNCFVIRWSDWLRFGPFDSNALGPGQSEDFALSQKIKAGGGLVATLDPPVAIHCGLENSEGKPAVGHEEMLAMALEQCRQNPNERVMLWRPKRTAFQKEYDVAAWEFNKNSEAMAKAAGIKPVPSELEETTFTLDTSRRSVRNNPPLVDASVPVGDPRLAYLNSLPKDLSLNVGSGQRRFETAGHRAWVNIDSQSIPPNRVPDLVCNVGKEPLPYKDGSVDLVVLHHILEHFGCGEGTPMLQECWRVLRPEGSLLIFVPDMKALAGRWLGGELDDQLFFTNAYGAYMGDEADRHRWGFTRYSLYAYLREAVSADAIIKQFDWREIPGARIAKDWWILGTEAVKL